MAKGDFTSLKIDDFSKGVNLKDPIEELDVGYLGSNSVNVLPVGGGKSLTQADGYLTALALSAPGVPRIPAEFHKYATGLILAKADGNVDRLQQNGTITAMAGAGGDALGPPEVVVSQDSTLSSTYFAYIIRPTASVATSVKVNLTTLASVSYAVKGTCAISWKTRMIIGSGNRVTFSPEGNPDSFPVNNFIDIKTLDDELDPIVGFNILGEDLIVFKRKSTWIVFDPVTFDNRRLFSVGLVNRRCSDRLGDRIYWLATNGVYSTDGSELKRESQLIDPNNFGGQFSAWWASAGGPGNPNASVACTPDGRVVICDGNNLFIGYSENRDINGVMPWYHRKDSSIFVYGLIWSSSDFTSLTSSDTEFNKLLGGVYRATGDSDVSIILDSGFSSNVVHNGLYTAPVKAIVELPTFHNSDIEGISRLRRLNLYGHGTFGSTGVASIDLYKDNGVSPVYSSVPSVFTSEFMKLRPEKRGKNFKVVINSDGNTSFWTLHAVEAQFRRAGR